MVFSVRLLYFGTIQVLLMSVITYVLISNEYRKLSSQSLQTLSHFLIEQKKQELKNYTSLAVSSINHLYQSANIDNKSVQAEVSNIFGSMQYSGKDGYFFVYDDKGTNISHPAQPFRVGKNWWDLTNAKGEKMIQIIVNNAKSGGDFYTYTWSKPSKTGEFEKMAYSIYLEKWHWVIGTGVYLDDVNNQLNKLQQEIDHHINRTKQIILLVAMSAILVLFILGLIAHLNNKKKADLKIYALGKKIINLEEEERKRISRELHDGIIQVLVSIKYSIEATGMCLKKAQHEKPIQLQQAEKNLSAAIGEVRRISHNLHPMILDELGFSAAVTTLGVEFSERTGIDVKVIKPSVRKLLPDYINITLYRVVQESLTNIEKYAQASEVVIELSMTKKWLKLSITDNGKGFDVAAYLKGSKLGIGLRNLAERVEYHSGEFEFKSSSSGTIIIAKIPKISFVNHFNNTVVKDVNS